MDLSGHYYIDGKDIWNIFSMFVESGSDDFLKYASRKESITHDWGDENGKDIDTTRHFLNDRNITLRMAMIVESETDFWQKYQGFLAQMILPGKRRVEPKRLGERSFYLVYKECTDFTSFTKIKDSTKIGIKFTVNFIEPNPQIENDNVFIVDEDGRFLIT
jgi:hypothetical protein